MSFVEGGSLIDSFEEIIDIVAEEFPNPTIDRLMFIETKPKDGKDSKIFPCYIESWSENLKKERSLQCCIIQSTGSEISMVRVNIPENDLNTRKRFWDKPVKKAVRDETPWIEVMKQ